MIADYHIHTSACGHAVGGMEEYVERAISLGLTEMGFSDHMPLLNRRDPSLTMDLDQLPLYSKRVEELREKFPQISIKLGIEADYLPGYERETRKLLSSHPFDFVYGSVHFIDGWGFDDERELKGWALRDVDRTYREYFKLLRASAETRLFDIIAHPDLIKKFGHRPTEDMRGEMEMTAEVFKKTGVAAEVNSSGLRKPVGEPYPSSEYLRILRRYNIPIVLGSDAHTPKDVGRNFREIVGMARGAGYRTAAIFERRRIAGDYPLREIEIWSEKRLLR
ncbi:MAG: histidinol-phosphatase HisJ family protein [bacterium]